MRVISAFLVAFACLLVQPAWAGVLDRLRAGEPLRIGFREDAAPFSFRDAMGKPAGYTVELCGVVVGDLKRDLGLPDLAVEFVPVESENRIAALQEGTIDLLCGATTATLSRRAVADFSIPTFIDGASVLYRADGPTDFPGLVGRRVGVRSGTTTETVLKEALAELGIAAEIVSVDSHKDGLARLESGDLTAYFADQSILVFLLFQSADRERLVLSDRFFTREPYALALPRGDDDFRLAVDTSLSRLYRSGKIVELFGSAFGLANPSNLLQALYMIAPLPE